MSIDGLIMKRLIRIKQVFQHGQAHRMERTDFSNMLATHHYYWAIEMLLRLLADTYKERLHPRDNMFTIWDKLDPHYINKHQEKLPIKNQVDKVRKARNQVQHSGSTTARSDTENYESYTRTFIEDVIQTEYNLSLNELRISSIIIDEKIKKLIKRTEQSIDQNEYTAAILHLDNAFNEGLSEVRINYQEDLRKIIDHNHIFYTGDDSDTNLAFDNVEDVIYSIEALIELQALNVRIGDYARYKRITSYRIQYERTSDLTREYFSTSEPPPLTLNDINFCYNFITTLLLLWQESS